MSVRRWILRRMIFWLLIAPVLVYGLLAGYLYLMQDRIVYHPTADWEATPGDFGIEFEDVVFRSADGVKLSGWYCPLPDARGTFLLCHGNGGNISHRMDSIATMHAMGYSIFVFDYRGYGRSEGRPSEEGTYADARAAWEYLTEQQDIDPGSIVVHGRSLGGAVASWLAGEVQPACLILEAASTSVADVGHDMYPFFPGVLIRLLSRYEYNTAGHLADVRCPVLIVHAREDEMIPFSHGRELLEAAGEPKAFLELDGGHNDGFVVSGVRYQREVSAFVDRYLPGGDTIAPATPGS